MDKHLKEADIDETQMDKQMDRTAAIILSMTKRERACVDAINPSRKRRIAAGSGTKVEDVNRLIKQLEQMQQMMKQFGGKGKKRRPVITSTDGRWVAMTRCMPAARAIWAKRQMESSTSLGATIIRSASSSMMMTIWGSGAMSSCSAAIRL